MSATKKNFLYAGLNFGFRTFNNLVVFGLLARIIGLASFGLLSYLITVATILATITGFGYRMFIVKEVSIDPKSVSYEFLANKVLLKTVTFTFLMGILAIYFFNKEGLNLPTWSILLFFTSAIFIAFSNFIFSFFHSIDKFYLESVCLSLFTAALIIGTALTWYYDRMRWFMLCYLAGSVLMMIFSWVYFYRNFEVNILKIGRYFSLKKVLGEVKIVLPFAIISIADNLFNSVDTLVLEAYVPKEDLGVYFGCLKMILGLSIISVISYSASFPIISKIMGNPTRLGLNKILQLLGVLVLAGIGVSFIYLFFSQEIANLLFGSKFSEYSQYSVNTFDWQIVLFTISRYIVIVPAIYLLVSGNQLKRVYALVTILLISTCCYFYFIPIYGVTSAMNIVTAANILLGLLYITLALPSFIKNYKLSKV